ncbi:hypothetical protein FNF29_07179 [Cafeteria roenbergensis]|uniref:KN homeodomain domain-containing protein n=1 Tax=Cafeteria roenbergensis TaxID=33653 RepID=A0A5A8C534_CAFRO|nr:hypothetical protein FNF28_07612 [Cafeteria roenbergensis]KAA0147725.1 hypothetical protein FNF29_07179 [Cafeteria roenbergensis]|eukprot:KAA0147725.1 hypothetical protein FNF29_07179 [Cafeteria roenbergensis]
MDEASLAAEAERREAMRPLQNRAGLGWADVLRQTHRSVRRTLMRKHPAQHREDVTVVLYAWLFEDGFDFPYVTNESRASLMAQTGLDAKQLGYWLTNARKRVWAPIRKRLGLELVTAADRIRVQARCRAQNVWC